MMELAEVKAGVGAMAPSCCRRIFCFSCGEEGGCGCL